MNSKGFTLIEIMIVIVLIGVAATIVAMSINLTPIDTKGGASQVKSDLSTIEMAAASYQQQFNTFPTSLTDATFVPAYLMPPRINNLFDTGYGTSGYFWGSSTGQPTGQNGVYISFRAVVAGPTADNYLAIKKLASQLPPAKFFYNTTGPYITNMADPAGAATVYGIYWITRY